MKTFFSILLLLILAIFLGFFIHQDSGYILISYQNWSIETSLWFGIIIFVFAVFCLYFLIRIFFLTASIPHRYKKNKITKRQQYYFKNLRTGLKLLLDGRWAEAEKKLTYKIRQNQTPALFYIFAIQAAFEQNKIEQVDTYLEKASASSKVQYQHLDLIKAKYLLSNDQPTEALSILRPHINKKMISPKMAEIYTQALLSCHQFDSILKLIPSLIKNKTLTLSRLQTLATTAAIEKLQSVPDQVDALHTAWQQLPSLVKNNEGVLYHYFLTQSKHDSEKTLSQIIKVLKKQWHPRLLQLITPLAKQNPAKVIVEIEGWLNQHPDCQALLICLCQLYTQEGIASQREQYLEQLLQKFPNQASYLTSAQIYQRLNQYNRSTYYYELAYQHQE